MENTRTSSLSGLTLSSRSKTSHKQSSPATPSTRFITPSKRKSVEFSFSSVSKTSSQLLLSWSFCASSHYRPTHNYVS